MLHDGRYVLDLFILWLTLTVILLTNFLLCVCLCDSVQIIKSVMYHFCNMSLLLCNRLLFLYICNSWMNYGWVLSSLFIFSRSLSSCYHISTISHVVAKQLRVLIFGIFKSFNSKKLTYYLCIFCYFIIILYVCYLQKIATHVICVF